MQIYHEYKNCVTFNFWTFYTQRKFTAKSFNLSQFHWVSWNDEFQQRLHVSRHMYKYCCWKWAENDKNAHFDAFVPTYKPLILSIGFFLPSLLVNLDEWEGNFCFVLLFKLFECSIFLKIFLWPSKDHFVKVSSR